MSRKLDNDSLEFIDPARNEAVYNDISAIFASTPVEGRWEIELLGKSHPLPEGSNILRDGKSVAIPKSKLVQAFVFARKRYALSKHYEDVFGSTAVVLLMDPEHLTAANARKRAIKSIEKMSSSAELEVALKRELAFIDSLLTSPLHRHSKSPTLWSHRRWILNTHCSKHLRDFCDVEKTLTGVVMIAAERHPRNYYAWLHMRWIVETFAGVGYTNRVLDGRLPARLEQENLLLPIKNWCLRHPSDTSGWSFLLFVLFSYTYSANTTSMFCSAETHSSTLQEALRFTRSFRWSHESVWVFLRTLLDFGRITDENKRDFMETFESTSSREKGKFLIN